MEDLSKMTSAVTLENYRQAKELLNTSLQEFPKYMRTSSSGKVQIPQVKVHAQKIVDNYEMSMEVIEKKPKSVSFQEDPISVTNKSQDRAIAATKKRSTPASSSTPPMEVEPEHSWQEIWQAAEAAYQMHREQHQLDHNEALQQVMLAAKPSEVPAVLDYITASKAEVRLD